MLATFACREAKGIVSRCLFLGPGSSRVFRPTVSGGGGNTRRGCLPGASWEAPVAESGRSCPRYFFLPSRSSVISAAATTAVMGSTMSISFLRACDRAERGSTPRRFYSLRDGASRSYRCLGEDFEWTPEIVSFTY